MEVNEDTKGVSDDGTPLNKIDDTQSHTMTTSTDNESLGSNQGTSGNGSDTDSWTLLDQEEESRDHEKLKIELFANRDLAVFARAAVQALELTTSLSRETLGSGLHDDDIDSHQNYTDPSPNTSKGHTTDSDIETIDEIHTETDTNRDDTPPTTCLSPLSLSSNFKEAEESKDSITTVNSDGIPVVEDDLSPDGNSYVWSREEGIHSDDETEEVEPFSTIIKKPSSPSDSTESITSAYPEPWLPVRYSHTIHLRHHLLCIFDSPIF